MSEEAKNMVLRPSMETAPEEKTAARQRPNRLLPKLPLPKRTRRRTAAGSTRRPGDGKPLRLSWMQRKRTLHS